MAETVIWRMQSTERQNEQTDILHTAQKSMPTSTPSPQHTLYAWENVDNYGWRLSHL